MAADFRAVQRRFAAHLRDPKRHRAPAGIEARRLRIYADLFYNNIEGFLAKGFPVIRRLTPDRRWHALVREFFASHRCRTPLFHQIAGEFVRWLAARRPRPGEPAFLRELAHYEWVELELATAPDPTIRVDADGDLVAGRPALSPVARLLEYRFPVHRISPNFRPRRPDPEPTRLVVCRTRDDAIRFLEVNALTARLLELIRPGRLSGAQALTRLARELHGKKSGRPHEELIAQGAQLLVELRRRDILLGTRLNGD